MDIKEYLQSLIGKKIGVVVNGEEQSFIGKLLSVETDHILMGVPSRDVIAAIMLDDITVVEIEDGRGK